jgi:uncharacterized protein YjdB
MLVVKNAPAPAATVEGITTPANTPRLIDPSTINATTQLKFNSTVHVQNVGDQKKTNVTCATVLGTSGRSLRVEAIALSVPSKPYSGGLEYRTHIQNKGWEPNYVKELGRSGTAGQSLRLEAIQIKLTGDMEKHYDVYYRTHIQEIGWTGWAKNGQECGSAGYSYRMEAMQILIVPKNQAAPGLNGGYFYKR